MIAKGRSEEVIRRFFLFKKRFQKKYCFDNISLSAYTIFKGY